MDSKNKKILSLSMMLFILLLSTLASAPAIAADDPIATLTGFSGTILIRSQGSWEVEPREGLPLYSDDKVVTRMGTAVIEFEDGAVLEVRNNSNLNIIEKEEEKGLLSRVQEKTRSIRLLVGKLLFKTGSSSAQTKLETSTMVCGLRGTAGTLSIGADGQTYIQFTEGEAAYTIGDFISGVAEDVPAELADLNPVQRAAFVAKAAADQAKQAAELVKTGQASDADLALARANAAKAAAEEVLTVANTIIENSPDEDMVQDARDIADDASDAIDDAQETIDEAIEAGAEEVVTETGEEPGFDVEIEDETPVEDNRPASEI